MTIEDVIAFVAERTGREPVELTGPRQRLALALDRQIAYWLARQVTGASLHTLGRAFGGRDHTTILWGLRRLERERAESAAILQITDRWLEALGGARV